MINKIKIFSLAAVFLALLLSSAPVLAQNTSPIDDSTPKTTGYGLEDTLKKTGGGLITDVGVEGIVGKVIGAVLSFIGVIFFLLIFTGGWLWMTAQGNESQVKKAKDLIIAASIGLIIIMAAYAITSFIGQQIAQTK